MGHGGHATPFMIDETVTTEAISTKMQGRGTELNIFCVMEQEMSQHTHTFNTNLRDPSFLSSNENLQTAEISSDMQIHHICKL